MRRSTRIVATLGIIAAVTIAWRVNPTDRNPTLHGAWVVTSWDLGGAAIADPQPGLIVFTETHYSMMYVNDGEPRPQYGGEQMTEAEVLSAYASFTANSGRYEVSRNELTTRAYVAKDPNYMASWPDNANTYTFRVDGETLHLTWPSDWPGTARTATFRRVEGEPAPW